MSSDREKKAKRIHATETRIKKQLEIAKAHGFPTDTPHRFATISATTCGDPGCHMCGNPRKFFKEDTIQEKSFNQTSNWIEP
jgi:hypothetical protein